MDQVTHGIHSALSGRKSNEKNDLHVSKESQDTKT